MAAVTKAFQDRPTKRIVMQKEKVQEWFAEAEFEEFKTVVSALADGALRERAVAEFKAWATELALACV
jgi:hypothetical protein